MKCVDYFSNDYNGILFDKPEWDLWTNRFVFSTIKVMKSKWKFPVDSVFPLTEKEIFQIPKKRSLDFCFFEVNKSTISTWSTNRIAGKKIKIGIRRIVCVEIEKKDPSGKRFCFNCSSSVLISFWWTDSLSLSLSVFLFN